MENRYLKAHPVHVLWHDHRQEKKHNVIIIFLKKSGIKFTASYLEFVDLQSDTVVI